MAETIYEIPREPPSRLPETTGQGASIQTSFQQKHDKIPHISSPQISKNKQVAANCTNTFRQGEHSTTTIDTSIGHDDRHEQLQHTRRRRADSELDDEKAAADLGGDRKRMKLPQTQETKIQASNQSLLDHANESSILQASSTARPDTGIPIPDSKTKKYWPLEVLRHPSLSAIELNSYKEGVIGRLKEAVDDHNILQDRAQFIDYKAGMVGPAPNQSWASILLFCQKKDQKHIKKLLDHDFLTRINCCSPYRPKFLPWALLPSDPMFWIYIFASRSNPTNRFAASETVVISFHTGSMPGFCGALAKHQGRVATVGLTVEIDGIDRLLTVDHIFNEEPYEDPSSDGDSDDESSWDYDSGNEDDDLLSETHSDLNQSDPRLTPIRDFHDEEEKASPDSTTSPEPTTLDDTQTHVSDVGQQNAAQEQDTANSLTEVLVYTKASAHKVQRPNKLNELPEHAYLDWACLELDGKTVERRSQSYILGPDKSSIRLQEIGDVPTSHTTSVLMISGINGARTGILLAGQGYLGSRQGEKMCQMWTLVLDSQPGLVPGECGSVVVDQDTHKVYGHVVGSNLLGYAHVVSMREVLDQIKIAFSTDLVYFPSRLSPPASPQSLSSDDGLMIQAPLTDTYNSGLVAVESMPSFLITPPQDDDSMVYTHGDPTEVGTFEPIFSDTYSRSYLEAAPDPFRDVDWDDFVSTEFSHMVPQTTYERPGSSAVKRSRSPADDKNDQEKKRTKGSRSHHSSNAALRSTGQTEFKGEQGQR